MKKICIILAAVFLYGAAFSQANYDSTKQLTTVSAYGSHVGNWRVKNSFWIPTDTIKLKVSDSSAIALKEGVLYYFTGYYWLAIAGGSSSSSGWSLTGDAGTTAGTNFIGTTDGQDFVTKVNNIESLRGLVSGAWRYPLYGSGTFTGTAATYPAFDASGNLIESATPYTGANIYNSDGTLTGDRDVNGGGNSIFYHDFLDYEAIAGNSILMQVKSVTDTSEVGVNTTRTTMSSKSGGQLSTILVYSDKVLIQPYDGKLVIDTLKYSDNTTDSMMVWNTADSTVGMRAIPTGGSGTVTSIATNDGTGITGGTITTTGTLAIDTTTIISTKTNVLQVLEDSALDVTRPTVNGTVSIFEKISSTNLQLSDLKNSASVTWTKDADSNLVATATGGISGLTSNELVYGNSATTIASLPVATYPSLTELSYVKGLTSSAQTQLTAKAPIASPTFTGTVTIPSPFTLGATSVTTTGARLNYLTSAAGTTGTTSSNIVFSTSPSLTTGVTGGATFSAFNTTTTNLSFAGAATTLNVGGTPTSAITHNYSANATATATTKTVNLGTGGASGSTSNINIGSANGGTTTINSPNVTAGTITARWKARVGSTTSSATPTINTDNTDIYKLTAQTADITSFTTNLTGTPNDGDVLEIQITGTAARAITWGASFVSSSVTLPATTVTTETLTVVFQYYTTSSYGNNKWVCANYY